MCLTERAFMFCPQHEECWISFHVSPGQGMGSREVEWFMGMAKGNCPNCCYPLCQWVDIPPGNLT